MPSSWILGCAILVAFRSSLLPGVILDPKVVCVVQPLRLEVAGGALIFYDLGFVVVVNSTQFKIH